MKLSIFYGIVGAILFVVLGSFIPNVYFRFAPIDFFFEAGNPKAAYTCGDTFSTFTYHPISTREMTAYLNKELIKITPEGRTVIQQDTTTILIEEQDGTLSIEYPTPLLSNGTYYWNLGVTLLLPDGVTRFVGVTSETFEVNCDGMSFE